MKALFFDIDGTLIDINTHRIPESTTQALRQAKARGNKIFIATGRSHTIVELPGLPKEVVDGYVTLNGAICLVDDVPVTKWALRLIPFGYRRAAETPRSGLKGFRAGCRAYT